MSNSLEGLMRLTRQTRRSGREYDAARVRAELGTDLPADYVALVSTFGCGLFDEAITLLEPGRPPFDLINETKQQRQALRNILRGREDSFGEDEIPRAVRPPNGDPLIAWAASDYGLNFYWRCTPWDQPDRWPVVAFVLAEPWHEYDMRATEFLTGLLAGSIEHPSWDPIEHHSFTPLDELSSDEPGVTAAAEATAWVPDVDVRIGPGGGLDPNALFRWLLADEEVESINSAIGVFGRAETGFVEVTLRGHRGRPVLGRSVAAWMRSANTLFTGKLTCDDSTVSVEDATPEAVEDLITTLGTVE
jgi:hypothetical protein